MLKFLSLSSLFCSAALAFANDPVSVKLVPVKASYVLDLQGKTSAEYKAEIETGAKTGKFLPRPEVELNLEIKNTTDKDVKVWVGGDPTELMLDLKGPAPVTVKGQGSFTREFRSPRVVTIAAGKTHSMPVTFSYGFRNVSWYAYWTDAGEYTLSASFKTGVSPPPKGVKAEDEGFARVTLKAEPVKLEVKKK